MITEDTEDYVSFETAKLLKEKGFDAECDYLYVDGELVGARGGACNWNKGETLFTDYKNECSAPTLQVAMKWLREVHKIDVWVECHNNNERYKGYIHSKQRGDEALFYEDSYETACEAAIRYCLENLI